ncbi:hypothetical protein PIB30_082542 [Stylosanthes scabra]|uniref:Uncharacterized protein n=1 Tax=Stylosanthes scabra TaxID=79078 RepID=A0ABU6TRI2_9FABA|nr:hypothetical protein [Stylosanthes scabra]
MKDRKRSGPGRSSGKYNRWLSGASSELDKYGRFGALSVLRIHGLGILTPYILSDFSGTGSSLKGWRRALLDSTQSSFSEDRILRCVVRRTMDISLEWGVGLVSSVEPKLRRFRCV